MSDRRRARLAVLTPLGVALAWLGCDQILGNHEYTLTSSASGSGGGATSSSAPGTGTATTGTSATASGSGGADAGCDAATCNGSCTSSDPKNCGSCAHDCLGGACLGGQCQPVVLVDESAYVADSGVLLWDIAVDARRVYWTTNAKHGEVSAVPLDGGKVISLETGAVHPLGVEVNDASAYFTGDQQVHDWSTSGDAGSALFFPASGSLPGPNLLFLDTTEIYWTDGTVNGIYAAPLDDAGAGGLLFDASVVGLKPNDLVKVGTTLYWTGYIGIGRASLTANDAGILYAYDAGDGGGIYPAAIAAHATDLYWTEGHGGKAVWRMPLNPADAGPAVQIASSTCPCSGIAADGKNVYWTSSNGGIYKLPLNGTCLDGSCFVYLGNGRPFRLALDAKAIYWTDQAGYIMKLAK